MDRMCRNILFDKMCFTVVELLIIVARIGIIMAVYVHHFMKNIE